MNAAENDHEWFSHQLATYLAGGLSDAAERARFETHAASCGRCAADLHHAQQLEGKMSELFALGIPDSDFEQRIATRLRFRLDKRQWVNPKVRKAAIAAAAVLMFGGWGYLAQDFVGDGKLPSFDTSPTQFAMNLKDRLMGQVSTDAPSAAVGAPSHQGTAFQAQEALPSATLKLGNFQGRTAATTGALDIAATATESSTAAVDTTSNHGVLAPYVAGQPSAGNSSLDFVTTNGTREIRVQNGGTFRLGTPGGAPQNAGSITTASTGLLMNVDSGGTIDVRNAADADGDGISDKTRFDAFKSAPGVTWAGNGGQIVGNIRHGSGTQSPGALTTSGGETLTLAGTFDMGGKNRQIQTANGTGVFSGPLTGGSMVKTGPNATRTDQWANNSGSRDHFFQGDTVRFDDVGAGTVRLNGTNTYTGGTTVNFGTVRSGHDQLASAGGIANSVRGGRIDLNGFAQTIDEINAASSGAVNGVYNASGRTIINGGTLLSSSGTIQAGVGNATVNIGNGNVVLDSNGKQLSNYVTSSGTENLTVNDKSPQNAAPAAADVARSTYTFQGAGKVTGDAALTKTGAGKLDIGNIASLTSGGTSNAAAPSLPAGAVTVSAGTLDFAAPGQTSTGSANSAQRLAQGVVINGKLNITEGHQLDIRNANFYDVNVGTPATSGDAKGAEARASDPSITVAGGSPSVGGDRNTFGNNGAASLNITQGTVRMTSRSADGQRFGIPSPTVNIGSGSSTYAGGTKLNASTLTVTGSGAFDMNGRTQALNSGTGAGTNDLVAVNGDVALDPKGAAGTDKPQANGAVGFDGWKKTGTGSVTIANGTLPTSGNGAVSGQQASGTNMPAQSSNPVPTVNLDGPFSLPGINAVETKSEILAFKPADALAANSAAKPQAGVNPNGLIVVGDISSKPTDGAQARLQTLQSDGQIRSSTYTPIDTLQSSVPAQVANGVGAGDKRLLPSGGQVQLRYENGGELRPNQTTPNQSQGSLATRDQLAQAVSQPVGGPAGDANSGGAVVAQAQANAAAARRVIREGTMEFEVDSFDSTFNQIATIVGEEGGFIAAADSDKLPNGKVRGMVTVRVPPDRLDLLVLKLRALGELKSQKLGSRDVGKEYTDIESELRAARAMEARLLDMIAKAQGKVAELLEAEKELATWRTKIEKMTGTLNYYNNLISMATLNLQLYEKDIRTPASANITEEISTGVETEDVEVARNAALKAIDEAKGRIIESNLQKLEAGQFAAKIIAEVAPENAGPIIDRLKQLGRLARYDVQKKQTNEGAKNVAGAQSQAPVRLETIPTRIVISLYNLANVAPRLTNNLNIAGDDVEAVYRAILKRVNDVGGRVVSSNLNRQDRAQVTGTMQFEIKSADADAVLNDVRLQGIVLRMVVNENPDTANVTTAKQAFVLSIIPTAQLSAKNFVNMNLAAEDVEAAYGAILKRINASAGSRVISSNLNRQDAAQINGTVQFELKSEDADAVINDLRLQGLVLRMNVGENADGMNVTTVKRSYTLQVVPMATLSPKLTTNLNLAAADVEGMYNSILKIVSSSGGSRVLSSNLSRQDATQAVGSLQFEVKSDEAPAVLNEIRKNVQVLQLKLLENPDNANVTTAKQAFVVQIIPTSQVQPREVRTLGIQTSEVESAVQLVTASVANVGGRMIDSSLSQDKNGTTVAQLAIEVPLDKTEQIADMIRKQGTVRSAESTKNTQIPDGPLSRARLNVTLATGETIVPSEGGFGNSIREGLSTSVKGLLWSLQLIVIGVCLVAPWLLLMWGGWRFLKKRKRATPEA